VPNDNGQVHEEFEPWDPSTATITEGEQCPVEDSASTDLDVGDLPPCPLTRGGNPPKVGSPEWCACISDLEDWVADVGTAALDWLWPGKDEPQATGWVSAVLRAVNPTHTLWDAIKEAAPALSDKVADKVQTIRDAFRDMLSRGKVCNPAQMLGIEACRALLSALHNLRIGTDALVWLTVDIEFTISVLQKIVGYLANHVCPVEIPSVAESITCYTMNSAPEGQLRCWSAMQGADWDVWKPVRQAVRRKPELGDLFTLRNREVIGDSVLDKQLRVLGFSDDGERSGMPQLRYEVPGPSDLVHFAVRHVFEPDLIAELGYNDEYRPVLDAFHHAQGIDYPVFSGPLEDVVTFTERENNLAPGSFLASYAQAGLPEPTWARAYWWSHWILPSPTQGYEMLFRLDPDRDKTGEPAWMQRQEFDLEHLRLLLRANDYPPYWRDKLAAIAYRAPNLRFLRVQIQTKTITHAQAVSQLRQMGFRPDYAEMQARALEKQIADQEAEKLFRLTSKQLESGWELGLVDDTQLQLAYRSAGLDQNEAELRLQAATFKRNTDVAKELVGQVHKGYLRYLFNWPQADQFLIQVGIVDRRRNEYRVRWDAERQARRTEATASQIKKAAIDGTITIADYAQRLRNMGWSDDAIELSVAEVKLQLAQRQTRALEKMAAEEQKTNAARLAALKAVESQLKAARAELARHGTPAQLKTWYCEGSIGAPEATARLSFLGWPQADINRLLGECDGKRAKLGLPPYSAEQSGSP